MEPRLSPGTFLVVHGTLTLKGREPDGDSVRFIPKNLKSLLHLPGASRLRPARDDSLQLRIDAIDAPETHFMSQAQPLGLSARTTFLKTLGFSQVVFNSSGVVTNSVPISLLATIFVGLLDPYGRPVSYVIVGSAAQFQEGAMVLLETKLLEQTANIAMLKKGAAYITLYSSTPAVQRAYLFAVAKAAHAARLGVWGADKTHQFALTDHASIGPDSHTLILPKLFRRCTSYIDAVAAGYSGNLEMWLQSTIGDSNHAQDDFVIRSSGSVVRLHELIHSRAGTITTDLDLLGDVFIEQ